MSKISRGTGGVRTEYINSSYRGNGHSCWSVTTVT